jgi:hypothetical protein
MSPMILLRDPAWYVRHCCLCGRSLAGVATADPIRITRDGVPVEAGVRLAEVLACIVCPHYAGIGDCGWPETRATGFSGQHLREVDIAAAYAGVPGDCPLPKAGMEGER